MANESGSVKRKEKKRGKYSKKESNNKKSKNYKMCKKF